MTDSDIRTLVNGAECCIGCAIHSGDDHVRRSGCWLLPVDSASYRGAPSKFDVHRLSVMPSEEDYVVRSRMHVLLRLRTAAAE
jgi:hypothetical protein